MQIQNRFELPVPPDMSWTVVTDLPRVASCLPGAQITEIRPDGTHHGTVAVALGPASLSFAGDARVVDADPEARQLVVQASGGERRGRGRASARIHVQLEPTAEGTRVTVNADLELTGAVAQYGRRGGMLEDVSELLIEDFVVALREEILHGEPSEVRLTSRTETVAAPLEQGTGVGEDTTAAPLIASNSTGGLSALIPGPAPTPGSPASRMPRKPPEPDRGARTPPPPRQRPSAPRAQPSRLSALSLARKLLRRRLRRFVDRLRRRDESSPTEGPRS